MNDTEERIKKIKDKVQKLLALSKSPNESEAASALSKAKSLLLKHGLKMDLMIEGSNTVKEEFLDSMSETQAWEEKLIKSITKTTFTSVIKLHYDSGQQLNIIGREINVITAKFLYDYLHGTIIRKAQKFTARIIDTPSLCMGIVDSICLKLEESSPKKTVATDSKDIIPVFEQKCYEENTQYIQSNYQNIRTSDNWYGVDQNSYGLGKSIGKTISINKPIEKHRQQ